MKIAEIDWPLFWQRWRHLDAKGAPRWLERWVFAADGVRLSNAPNIRAGERFKARPPDFAAKNSSSRPVVSGQTHVG